MAFDLRDAINAISDVVQNRPPPIREVDQIYMKVADMAIQAGYIARVLDRQRVVFIGDGDGISLSVVHLTSQDIVSGGPESILVLDFDERIVNAINRFAENRGYEQRITARLYNVIDPLPSDLIGQFDSFHTNPPWGASNDGESVCAFMERGIEAVKPDACGMVIIADDKRLCWTQQVLHRAQALALERGFVVAEMQPELHHYHLDDAPDLQSCAMFIRRTGWTHAPSVSMPMAKERFEKFYGRKNPLTIRYIRDRLGLHPGKAADLTYIIEPLKEE